MKKMITALALVLALTFALSGFAMADLKSAYIVGTNPEFAPFEFIGDDGQPTGIDMDIIKAIFEQIDPSIEVTIECMAFDGLISAMTSGKIDLAIAGMSVTEDRKKSVNFTDNYFDATQVIVVKEGSAITGSADLDGKKLGVQLGTTGDTFATDAYPGAEFSRFEKVIDAINDTANGRLDATVIDEQTAKAYVAQTPGLVILPEKLSEEVYAIPLRKDDTELLEKINEALTAMKQDGTIQAIIEKYDAEG